MRNVCSNDVALNQLLMTIHVESLSSLIITMAANKAVTVLAPNGRRQNVKVTVNTTILQVHKLDRFDIIFFLLTDYDIWTR